MIKRLAAMTATGICAALALASGAYAATCLEAHATGAPNPEPLNASEWLQTPDPHFSYTDVSVWSGDGGKGYTAERINTSGQFTYFLNIPDGGGHFFDNGSTSPYRKTSFYNWYNNSNYAHIAQNNDNGSCW